MDKNQLIAMAQRVFPEPKKSVQAVEAASESVARSGSLDGLESLNEGAAAAEEAEIFGVPRSEVLVNRLKEGASALEKVRKGKTDLTPSEELGLEAIVLLVGRPALLVQDGDFGTPPDEWKQLEEKREMLKTIFPSIGRVDLDGHHTFQWCGTAFLVGDGVLMTNKHVAQIFSEQRGREWKFLTGVKARVDYKEEYQRDDSTNEFKIDKVLGIHPTYDLALLSVAKKSGKKVAPPVLTVSSKGPKTTKDGEVAVIGYPAFDTRNGRNEQIEIFKNIFDVKRLQPGKSTGLKQAPQILGHDCSTLGGNSGSCIVDLETGNVIALHFGGQYLKGNVSVPLWKLAADPLLKKHKVNFA